MKNINIILVFIFVHLQIYTQSKIYDVKQIEIHKTYQEISPLGKYRYDEASYNEAKNQTTYSYEKFSYKSDEFKVEAFVCKPKTTGTQKSPVIIYNRGGTGNFGKLSEEDLPDFYWLAKKGFTVFASNYRFVNELGKIDQSGGDDVNDVIHLYQLIKTLDFVDPNNIFMMGISRGGMMTYLSLKKINLNAAAVIGGVADMHIQAENRPIFIKGWSDLTEEYNYKGLENILPNFKVNRQKYLDERSATKWAKEINTPIYILHSRQDGRVSVNGAFDLAQQLNTLKKSYKLKIYDKKSHSLPYSKFDTFEEIIKWFKSHMK